MNPTKRRRWLIMRSRNIRSRNIRSPRASVRRMSARTHGVYIEPAPSRPAYAEPPRRFTDEDRAPGRASASEDERLAGPYVPPAPEQPARAARMPQIEDFPRPGQDQLRQARGEISQADQRRKSIFERLASFGSSRQEDAIQSLAPQPQPQPSRSANTRRSRSSPRPRTPNTPSVPPPAARPKRRSPASISTAAAPCRSAASRRIVWKSRPFCGVRAITNFNSPRQTRRPASGALYWRRALAKVFPV